MVRLAAPTDRDTVIEIGPGTGQLTRLILARARNVVAIEFDRDLVDHLKRSLGPESLARLTPDPIRRAGSRLGLHLSRSSRQTGG